MALKIRLARGGAKKRPFYSIVIADSRSPRDGRFIEKVGTYNPMVDKGHAERLVIKEERVKHWLGVGALPTDRVAKFFGDVGLGAKPGRRETPSRSAPKAKAQERAKAADEAAKAAAPEAEGESLGRAGTPRLCVGIITGAQGVRGAVRIKSFTAVPEAVAAYGPVADEAGQREFALRPVGRAKGVVIATIAGVADRDAAERLKGVRLYVARDKLPAPGEEEYYHADLIGLAAVLRGGTPLGRGRAGHEYGAGDSLEGGSEGGVTGMGPFTRAAGPEVDLAAGRLGIEPLDGLLDKRAVEAESDAET